MGKCQMHEQILHMPCLCHGSFQKFSSRRNIVKKLPYQKCCSIRCSRLFDGDFFSPFNDIPGPQFFLLSLCDQLCLCHCSNTGEGLAPESQGTDMGKILHAAYFACRMAQKSTPDFFMRDSASIIHNADQ